MHGWYDHGHHGYCEVSDTVHSIWMMTFSGKLVYDIRQDPQAEMNTVLKPYNGTSLFGTAC